MNMNKFTNFSDLDGLKNHPISEQIDDVFRSVIKEDRTLNVKKDATTVAEVPDAPNELSLDDFDSVEIDLTGAAELPPETSTLDEGMELNFSDDEGLDLGNTEFNDALGVSAENFGNLSLDDQDFSLEEASIESTSSSNDSGDKTMVAQLGALDDLSLSDSSMTGLKLTNDMLTSEDEALSLSFGSDDDLMDLGTEADLSDDAKKKLKEIDAIMDLDASKVDLTRHNLERISLLEAEEEVAPEPVKAAEKDISDEPLVSDDLDLDSLDFGNEEKTIIAQNPLPTKKKKKEAPADLGRDLSEISGAYSGEMERMQATISNLRSDREELLAKIQKHEEDKVLQARQTLTMRAELDEKKIELTIIRKKLNEELNELKDRLKLFDEKKLILEEKNRILTQELDKATQKNKIDVKKVQIRERELEQKLELLKSDAESQIRHRDLKILELKRKIDAMEFDMESISMQEKRSIESRFELEDKLEKAIKTLRGAITVLEDESDRSNALDALKKNIDM
jgi:hypothetical protein